MLDTRNSPDSMGIMQQSVHPVELCLSRRGVATLSHDRRGPVDRDPQATYRGSFHISCLLPSWSPSKKALLTASASTGSETKILLVSWMKIGTLPVNPTSCGCSSTVSLEILWAACRGINIKPCLGICGLDQGFLRRSTRHG